MEKIILVGGFGFIGKNLIEFFYETYEIYIIGRNVDNEFMKKYPKLKFKKYSFNLDNGLDKILEGINPEYVLNLVSVVTAQRSISLFQDMLINNINVLLELYESSKKLNKLKLFLQFGSAEEYGNINSPFKEDYRESPNSPYALSKQLTTNTAMMLYNNYNFPITVVRPGNLFGKYQDLNKFIPYIVNKLIRNEEIVTTEGFQKRDFIYAEDFSEGLQKVIKNYGKFIGKIFNLSTGKSYSLREIIEYCKKILKSESMIKYGKMPYRENEVMNFKLDNSLFEDLISEKFEGDFYRGLIKYLEHQLNSIVI